MIFLEFGCFFGIGGEIVVLCILIGVDKHHFCSFGAAEGKWLRQESQGSELILE